MGRQRDGFRIQPENQTRRRTGGQPLAANVEFVPALRVKPAVRTQDMHHIDFDGLPNQPLLQRRHVNNLSPQRQVARPQPSCNQHFVECGHDLPAQLLVGRIDQ